MKQACQKAGIEIEIKSVTASVFFSSDVANPDTYPHFYCDLQMYTTGPSFPDPGVWMQSFLSREVSQKENKWQGRNITRWRSKEWDELYFKAEDELDPIKRASMHMKLNDMVVNDRVVIPVIARSGVSAVAAKLQVNPSGWDSNFWDLHNWFMDV